MCHDLDRTYILPQPRVYIDSIARHVKKLKNFEE